jgi:hypothetical protein
MYHSIWFENWILDLIEAYTHTNNQSSRKLLGKQ